MRNYLIGNFHLLRPTVIYDNYAAEVASGLLSSTRFFVEAMAVAEARCLPVRSKPLVISILHSLYYIRSLLYSFSSSHHFYLSSIHPSLLLQIQSGFTGLRGEAAESASFQILHYGSNDFDEIIQRSYSGWFWGAVPCLFVGLWIRWMGLGLMCVSNRVNQAKKPFGLQDANEKLWFAAYMVVLACFVAAALVFMLKQEHGRLPMERRALLILCCGYLVYNFIY